MDMTLLLTEAGGWVAAKGWTVGDAPLLAKSDIKFDLGSRISLALCSIPG